MLLSEIKRVHLQQENLNQRIEKRLQDQQTNAGKIIGHERVIESKEQAILQSVGEKNRLNEKTLSHKENLTKKENKNKKINKYVSLFFKC